MNVVDTKTYIIERINQLDDEALLNELRLILEQEETILLTDEQKTELDKRMKAHESGSSKNYTWEEVKKNARAKL